jgi:hypothetical protein
LALLLALAGCGAPEARVTTFSVTLHELSGDCAVTSGSVDAAKGSLALTALGRYAAEPGAQATLPFDDVGHELAFDARTVGIDAILTTAAAVTPADSFAGHSERRSDAGIDVLLWPHARDCALSTGDYPSSEGGQALGFSATSERLLVAGEDLSDEPNRQGPGPGSALVFDAELGNSELVPRAGALQIPRAFATVSAFGADLLVAGGDNPFGASELDAAGTAEVFSTQASAFDGVVTLVFERTHHAALTLPATGETLLVGGIEPVSDPVAQVQEIRLFEAISPSTRKSSISELAELSVGRVDPTALVLADQRLFVGGGYTPGPDGAHPLGDPLGLVEIFSPNARDPLLYAEFPARPHRSFVTLPGGGVLSVATCPSPAQRTDCTCVDATGKACDAADTAAAFVDALWMNPEGELENVAFDSTDARCPTPAWPRLVPGSDGSPWLLSASDGGPTCLWRFEPWPAADAAAGDVAAGPRLVPSDVTLTTPLDARTAPVSLGPDVFAWVAAGSSHGLAGARLGHRGPLSRDGELLQPAAGSTRPAHLAPDRNPRPPSGARASGQATFDPILFRLTLEPAPSPASAMTIWATDTLYDDFVATLALLAPASLVELPDVLPVLVIGDTAVGDSSCTWPPGTASSIATGEVSLRVARRGSDVTLGVGGTSGSAHCRVAAGSAPIGVRAGTSTTTLVSFVLDRG